MYFPVFINLELPSRAMTLPMVFPGKWMRRGWKHQHISPSSRPSLISSFVTLHSALNYTSHIDDAGIWQTATSFSTALGTGQFVDVTGDGLEDGVFFFNSAKVTTWNNMEFLTDPGQCNVLYSNNALASSKEMALKCNVSSLTWSILCVFACLPMPDAGSRRTVRALECLLAVAPFPQVTEIVGVFVHANLRGHIQVVSK